MRFHQSGVIAVVAVILLLVGCAHGQSCNNCDDGSQCCGDYATCCTLTNTTSTVCCPTTAGLCCDGYCCDAPTESCCSDPIQGGVCCEKQETFCCPSSAQHPNRCCPRWTVCCENDDQEGCCAPETLTPAAAASGTSSSTPTASTGEVIYVLFMEIDTVDAVHINASTGQVINQIPIRGFHNFGEMTRVFMFDGSRTLFYYLEANYTQPPLPNGNRPVTLWTINPITGVCTSAVVTNVYNNPTGWQYHCQIDKIIVATTIIKPNDPNETPIGFNFYSIQPDTAEATLLSTTNNLGDVNEWSGWFHALAANGSVSYRAGYQNVTLQQNFGLGITKFDSVPNNQAQSWWIPDVPLPPNHEWYQTLQVTPPFFLSLAPQAGVSTGYDLIRWSLSGGSGGTATVIAVLGNANPPPLFGPISDIVSCDGSTYVSAIVHDNPDSDWDRWALVIVNLSKNDEMNYLLINPIMMAKMSSISGVGLPQADSSPLCRRRSAPAVDDS